MLFVPADTERFLAKAGQRGADALILDLEDAVARQSKLAARENLATFVPLLQASAGVPIYVRVNNEPELLGADLRAAIAAGADGLLMPKVDSAAQVVQLDAEMLKLESHYQRALVAFAWWPCLSRRRPSAMRCQLHSRAHAFRLFYLEQRTSALRLALSQHQRACRSLLR